MFSLTSSERKQVRLTGGWLTSQWWPGRQLVNYCSLRGERREVVTGEARLVN